MSTFKERLNDEYIQLNEKIEKLESFITSANFESVEDTQQALLKAQLMVMKSYSTILYERLARLED